MEAPFRALLSHLLFPSVESVACILHYRMARMGLLRREEARGLPTHRLLGSHWCLELHEVLFPGVLEEVGEGCFLGWFVWTHLGRG